MKAEVGDIIVIEYGEYEDSDVKGPYVVRKEFDTSLIQAQVFDGYKWLWEVRVTPWLVKEGYIELLPHKRMYLDRGRADIYDGAESQIG